MKLHLGCGTRYLEGYVHIDLADYDHIDIKSSVDLLDKIENDFDYILYAIWLSTWYEVMVLKEIENGV